MNYKKRIILAITVISILTLSFFVVLHYKAKAPNQLKGWTLKQKIGQLMMVNFNGTEPDYYVNKMILERNLGGVILMGANIKDNDQVKVLTNALQYNTTVNEKQIPLFIAIDQEGGQVARLKDVNSVAQKDLNSEEQAQKIAKNRGEQLKNLGININFSPVLDFSDNNKSFIYNRTFQKDLNQSIQNILLHNQRFQNLL